jgi:hypothetical protein
MPMPARESVMPASPAVMSPPVVSSSLSKCTHLITFFSDLLFTLLDLTFYSFSIISPLPWVVERRTFQT